MYLKNYLMKTKHDKILSLKYHFVVQFVDVKIFFTSDLFCSSK